MCTHSEHQPHSPKVRVVRTPFNIGWQHAFTAFKSSQELETGSKTLKLAFCPTEHNAQVSSVSGSFTHAGILRHLSSSGMCEVAFGVNSLEVTAKPNLRATRKPSSQPQLQIWQRVT